MMRAVVVVIALVVSTGRAQAQLLSPGPLASAHATVDGDANCDKCHESGRKVRASLCLECHKDLGAEIAANRGLHGRTYKSQACETCHVEHLGRGTPLVRWPGGAREQLDHGQTGYPLDGGHRSIGCAKCHTKTSQLGKVVYIATSTACASCHKDPHQNRFTNQCQKCHVVADWKQWDTRTFDHDLARYPLTGKHVSVGCDRCHGAPAKWQGIAFAACDNCHADPHKGQFRPQACSKCHDTKSWNGNTDAARRSHPTLSLANGHWQVACKACHDRGNDKPPSKGSTCVACHAPVHVAAFGTKCEQCHASIKFVGLPESIGRANHDKTRYRLAGKHDDVDCAKCHPKSKPEAARYRNLRFGTCRACHADDHKGEFASFDNGECATCHTVNGFAPSTFGVTKHVTTGYTLDGRHAATPCGRCHTATKRPRVDWKVTKTECADCHANPHGEQFAKEMQTGGCAHCHMPYGWSQAKVNHAIWPLTGAHASAPCVGCHGKEPNATYRGVPRDCEGCHEDTHVAQFRQTAPTRLCKDCHTTETFEIAAFDHGTTRYPLDGAHVALACDRCHPAQELRDGTTAVRWRLGYIACKDCHADPHVASSRGRAPAQGLTGGMDCKSCHAATSWKLATSAAHSGFDHDRTGFPLRGGHVIACGECHGGAATPSPSCTSCHRDPHAGRMDGECYECHTAVAWSDVAQLEQHRRTRMPLTGKHAIIECTACHKRQSERGFTDLPVDCYSCHQRDYHRFDIHPDHDGEPNDKTIIPRPRDCGRCHRTAGWIPASVDPKAAAPPARRVDHEAYFRLATGSHRTVECAACHVDANRASAVRCDGCHQDSRLRGQHRASVPNVASACLRCHPRGEAR